MAPYRFLLRAFCFLGLFLALAAAAGPLLPRWPSALRLSLPEEAREVEALRDVAGSVAYLGDSVVHWGRWSARETTLPALVSAGTGLPLVDLSHAADGPRMHLAQLRFLLSKESRPRGVILALSPAALGLLRETTPGWRFGMRQALLESRQFLLVRLAAVFQHRFGEVTPCVFASTSLAIEGRAVATLGQLADRPADVAPEEHERRLLLAHYATDPTGARQWPALRQLLSELKASQLPHLVYVTPIDLELVGRRLDERSQERVRQKLARIAAELEASGVNPVDLSTALPPAGFDREPGSTTEHQSLAGRRAVAERIVAAWAAANR